MNSLRLPHVLLIGITLLILATVEVRIEINEPGHPPREVHRPVLYWIGSTIKRAVGFVWLAPLFMSDSPDAVPEPPGDGTRHYLDAPTIATAPLVRAMGMDGYPVLDNGDGW